MQLHFLLHDDSQRDHENFIHDLRVSEYAAEGNEEGRDAFPRFVDATVFVASLKRDDCVFIPGGWARQVSNNLDLEAPTQRVAEKMLLTYDYGTTSPWLNVALV